MKHIGTVIGAACGGLTSLAWLAAIWFPSSELTLSGASLVVAFAMIVLGILALIAAVRGHAPVLFVAFFISFFPVGAYLLSVEHWLRWVGALNVGFLLAGLLIGWHARRLQGRSDPGGPG